MLINLGICIYEILEKLLKEKFLRNEKFMQ